MFLGNISYTVYLFHWLVRTMKPTALRTHSMLPEWAYYSVAYAGVLVVSWLLFEILEQPAREWIRVFEPSLAWRWRHGRLV